MKKLKIKVKEQSSTIQDLKNEKNDLEIALQGAKDRISLMEDKMEHYKKQEMEMSLSRSIRSVTSEDMNSKLLDQNKY